MSPLGRVVLCTPAQHPLGSPRPGAIPPDTILTMLSEMLADKALEWYRNNRALWYSWDDFVEELRDFCLLNYEEVLESQIVNRRQRPGESGRHFIQAM